MRSKVQLVSSFYQGDWHYLSLKHSTVTIRIHSSDLGILSWSLLTQPAITHCSSVSEILFRSPAFVLHHLSIAGITYWQALFYLHHPKRLHVQCVNVLVLWNV